MSSKIDQRIVEMSFENQQFERGINESQGSLKEFERALRNMDAGKAFEGLDGSVGALSSSLSMLEQIGIGALRRIGESALDAGTQLVKSLSIDQLSAGFSKYEAKLNAMQAMVSAGYDLSSIEDTMENLMWFADETSYSFSHMAESVGRFVASGVELKTAERAVQGIANWAAHSGKNATDASIAMDVMSQSISTGYVDLRRWQTIMSKNMNTPAFKQVVIGVAEAEGAIKKGSVTMANFDSNLREKWFTSDVLLKSLEQFSLYSEEVKRVQEEMNFSTAKQAMRYMDEQYKKTGEYAKVIETIGWAAFKAAQESKTLTDSIDATMDAVSSGWLKTYEHIFGSLDEAIEKFSFLTDVLYEIFAAGGDARNAMLGLIREGGGIDKIFKGLKQSALAFLNPLYAISKAFDQFFPPKTEHQWLSIIDKFDKFTEKIIMSDYTMEQLYRTFSGFFAIVDLGWTGVKFLGSALLTIMKTLTPTNTGFMAMAASIGDFLVGLNKTIKASGIFEYALLAVQIAAILVRTVIDNLVGGIKNFVLAIISSEEPLFEFKVRASSVFRDIIAWVKDLTGWVGVKLANAFESIKKFLGKDFGSESASTFGILLNILKEGITFIVTEASEGLKNFNQVLKDMDFTKITAFVTGGVLLLFINQLTQLTKATTGIINTTNTFIANFSKKLFATQTKIKDFAQVIAVISVSLFVLSRVPWEDLKTGLKGFALALTSFVAAYALLQGINIASAKYMGKDGLTATALNLTALAAGIGIMAVALKVISSIDSDNIIKSTVVLGHLVLFLAGYQAIAAYISAIPGQQKLVTSLTGMAVGILGLISAIKLLNKISLASLLDGLAKMTTIFGIISVIQLLFSYASKIGDGNKLAVSLLGISTGILTLVAALKVLNALDLNSVSKGIGNLVVLGVILAGLEAIFGAVAKFGGGKLKSNLLTIELGMLGLVAMIKVLNSMEQTDIDRGLKAVTKMAGIIVAIEVLTALSAKLSGGAKTQRILAAVSLTMLSFIALVKLLGDPKDKEMVDRGLLTLAKMVGLIAAMEILAGVVATFSGNTKMFSSMIGFTTALLTLTASLILLSNINQEDLRKAALSLSIAAISIGVMTLGVGAILNSISGLSMRFEGLTSYFTKIKNGFIALAAVMAVTGVFFVAFGLVRDKVRSSDWEDLAKFAAGVSGLTVLLAALSAMSYVLKGTEANFSKLGPLLGVAGVALLGVGVLFAILSANSDVFKNVEWSTLAKIGVSLSALTVILSALVVMRKPLESLGGIPPLAFFKGVALSLGGVVLVVGAYTALAYAMEHLLGGQGKALARGIDILIEVSNGLGKMIGAFVGGIQSEILINYGNALSAFAKSTSEIEPGSTQGVKNLAEVLLILTANSLLDGLTRFISFSMKSPVEKFRKNIEVLIATFANIKTRDAKKASETMIALAPMTENLGVLVDIAKSVPNSGGLLGKVMGDNDIDQFGKDIHKFIKVLLKSPVNPENVATVANVINAMEPMFENLGKLSTLANAFPNSGGFLSVIMGNNDIDQFGRSLGRFIMAFNTDSVDVDKARNTAEIITELTPMAKGIKEIAKDAQEIPNSGWLSQLFAGNNDINVFGKKIAKVITTFLTFDQNEVRDVAETFAVLGDKFVPALKNFAELAETLPKGGTWMGDLFSGKSELEKFGKDLSGFVKQIKEVDLNTVTPAMDGLAKVFQTFELMGDTSLKAASESFEKNNPQFLGIIVQIIESVRKTIADGQKPINNEIENLFKAGIETAKKYAKEFESTGTNLSAGLSTGITKGQTTATNAVTSLGKSVITTMNNLFKIKSPSKVFAEIGGWLGAGLGSGIQNGSRSAETAAADMGKNVIEVTRDTLGVHSESKAFFSIGNWLPKSISSGIQSGATELKNTAKELGIDTSKMTVSGMTEELEGAEGTVTESIKSLMDLFTDSLSVKKAAKEAGEKTGGAVAEGARDAITDAKTGIGGSKTQAAVQSELAKLQAALEEGKYYGRISLQEELASYEALRLIKGQSAEDYKKIDREVYRLVKEIYEGQLSYITEVTEAERSAKAERENLYADYLDSVEKTNTEAQKKLSDLQTKYDKDVSSAQQSADKKRLDLEKSYQNDFNKILDNAEKERQRLREDYANKQKNINERLLADIQAQNTAYENAVKSRADAIYGSYGLFGAVEEDAEVTGEELLENLRDQGAALSEWQQSLDALAARGVGKELIEELQAMGPSSKAQLKALLTLTDEQLEEYVRLFAGKYTFARIKAETELEGLKDSTKEAIDELNKQAAIDLDILESEFADSMSSINSTMADDLQTLRQTYDQGMSDIQSDLNEKLAELRDAFQTSQSEINADLRTKLSDLESNYNKSLTKINSDLDAKLNDLKSKFSTTMKDVNAFTEAEFKALIEQNKQKLNLLNNDTAALLKQTENIYDQSGDKIVYNFRNDMQNLNNQADQSMYSLNRSINSTLDNTVSDFGQAGFNAALGFAAGITSGSRQAVQATQNMANSAINAARVTLDEASPSRILHEIGKFFSVGFANGISDYADDAVSASESMAEGPVSVMMQIIDSIQDIFDSEFDFEPVITPIVDLDNIKRAKLSLGNTELGLGLRSRTLAHETSQNGSKDEKPTSITNNFDLRGMVVRSEQDIDTIASKLYQKQQSALRGRGVRTVQAR